MREVGSDTLTLDLFLFFRFLSFGSNECVSIGLSVTTSSTETGAPAESFFDKNSSYIRAPSIIEYSYVNN